MSHEIQWVWLGQVRYVDDVHIYLIYVYYTFGVVETSACAFLKNRTIKLIAEFNTKLEKGGQCPLGTAHSLDGRY